MTLFLKLSDPNSPNTLRSVLSWTGRHDGVVLFPFLFAQNSSEKARRWTTTRRHGVWLPGRKKSGPWGQGVCQIPHMTCALFRSTPRSARNTEPASRSLEQLRDIITAKRASDHGFSEVRSACPLLSNSMDRLRRKRISYAVILGKSPATSELGPPPVDELRLTLLIWACHPDLTPGGGSGVRRQLSESPQLRQIVPTSRFSAVFLFLSVLRRPGMESDFVRGGETPGTFLSPDHEFHRASTIHGNTRNVRYFKGSRQQWGSRVG